MHRTIAPAILYAGTPVVLITTLNADGSANIAPMSSAWWLGWSCMLGLDATSKTTENLRHTRECVLNLASVEQVEAVDRLALLTGSEQVPLHKKLLGYRTERDKFAAAGWTADTSTIVAAPRIRECPIQMEARVASIAPFAADDAKMAIPMRAIEVRIETVHVREDLCMADNPDRIDPDRWKPLIMSFRKFYGVGEGVHPSRLARGPEEAYAPWKMTGLKGMAGRAALRVANAKHRRPEPASLRPPTEADAEGSCRS